MIFHQDFTFGWFNQFGWERVAGYHRSCADVGCGDGASKQPYCAVEIEGVADLSMGSTGRYNCNNMADAAWWIGIIDLSADIWQLRAKLVRFRR